MSIKSQATTETTYVNAKQTANDSFFKPEGSPGFFRGASLQPDLVQLKGTGTQNTPPSIADMNHAAFDKIMSELFTEDKILEAKARPLAKSYLAHLPTLKTKESQPSTLSAATTLTTARPDLNTPKSMTNEDRVVQALKPKMKLYKTGKGNSIQDWEFKWKYSDNLQEKTVDEKAIAAARWRLKEVVGTVGEVAMVKKDKLAIAAVKITIEILDEEMFAATVLATSGAPVVGTALLIIGFLQLLYELGEPVEKELEPDEQANEDIVNAVRDFLQHQEDLGTVKQNPIQPLPPPSDHYPSRPKNFFNQPSYNSK